MRAYFPSDEKGKQSMLSLASAEQTLIIGDLTRWQAEGRKTSAFDGFSFSTIDALDADILAALAPQIVLSPLMADTFDAFDVAARLSDLGYQGHYCALTSEEPNIPIIKQEVRAIAPKITFDVLILRDGS